MRPRRTVLILLLTGTCSVIALQKFLERKSGVELADLMSKTTPESVTLKNPWVGESKVVFRTDKWPIPSGPNRREGQSLVFDMFCFWSKTADHNPGLKTLGESMGTVGVTREHFYRTALPFNAVIAQAKTEADLVAVLGQAHHPRDIWWDGDMSIRTSAGWSLFSLSESALLQTLSVHCLLKKTKDESDWQVVGVEIARGTATPLR